MKAVIKGYIHYSGQSFDGREDFTFFSWDATKHGYTVVAPHTIEVELPENWNPVTAQISAIEAEKERIGAEFAKRVGELNEKLAKLQAIGCEVAS